MHAVQLPIPLHPSQGGERQWSRFGRLDVRDQRDDGSAIGGLFVGLGMGILAWGLVLMLLAALFW